MKLATLQAGQFVETGGETVKGDIGAARYLVVDGTVVGSKNQTLASGNTAVFQYSGATNNLDIINLQEGQTAGVIVFATYALLDAYTPVTAQEKASFKVTDDSNTSLNGYYSWVSGTVYTKDADLVVNTIDANNTSDAVSGKAVADYVEPNTTAINDLSIASLNLFNYEDPDVQMGYFVNWTNGNTIANASYNSTGFIEVTATLDYTVLYRSHTAYYDANKTYISGNNSATITEAAPANAEFMRVSTTSNLVITTIMISQSSSALDFEPFGQILKPSQLTGLNDFNYQDAAMSVFKTNYYTIGKNILDITESESGFRGSNGVLAASATYNVSDFIEVLPSTSYSYGADGVSTTMRFHTAYDEYKNVVSSEGSDSNATVLNVPATGVKYYKISYNKTQEPSNQLESGAVTPFESYGYTTSSIIKQKTITSADIALDSVAPLQTQFIINSVNLFDESTTESGFRGSSGTLIASSSYRVSDFIEVLPSTTYVSSNAGASSSMRFYTAYDESKVVVPSEGSDSSATSISVPATGVKYYKITREVSKTYFQLEEAVTPTSYVPYGLVMDSTIQIPAAQDKALTFYSSKNWTSYGDSITAQASWQPYTVARLGLVLTNIGVGGTKVSGSGTTSMNNDARVNTIPLDTEVLTILGGTNDWAQNVVLGNVDSINIQEFYGAFNVMLTKIYTRVPTAQVVMMSTPYGELYTYVPRGWNNAYTNNAGLTTGDYAEACRVIAKRWGIPLADTYSDSGWNTVNIRDFVKDDGGLLHPDVAGGKRMSASVTGKLVSLVV